MSKRPSEALRLLEAYTQAHGTSGHEDAVRAIFVRELRGRTLQCGTSRRRDVGGAVSTHLDKFEIVVAEPPKE